MHVSIKNSTITIQISNPRANMEEIGRLLEPLGAAEVNGGVITIHSPDRDAVHSLIDTFMDATILSKKLESAKKLLVKDGAGIDRPAINVNKEGKFVIELVYEPQAPNKAERQLLGVQFYSKIVGGTLEGLKVKDKDEALKQAITAGCNSDASRFDFFITVGRDNPDAASNLGIILDKELLKGSQVKFANLVTRMGVRPVNLELEPGKTGEVTTGKFGISGDEERANKIAEKLTELTGVTSEVFERSKTFGVKSRFIEGEKLMSFQAIEQALDTALDKLAKNPKKYEITSTRGR